MKKKSFMKFLIILMIVFIPFIIAVSPHSNQSDVNRGAGGCGECHGTFTPMTLTTNYSGNSIDITQGNTFDLKVFILNIPDTSKAFGVGLWHTSGDSIGVPVVLSTNTSGTFSDVDEWSDGADYYYGSWWNPAGISDVYVIYRITPSNSITTEYLYIQSATKSDYASPMLTFTINVTAAVADTTPPSVSISSPNNNSYVSGASVAITGTATDSGSGVLGSSVEAYVTNTTGTNNTISLSYTGPGFSGTWDSTSVFDGDYNITVKAQDNDGNTNVTEYVTVKVDNTAPSITLDSVIPDPSNGITTITATNSSSDIDGNGIRANITDPSSGETYVNLNYQGSNLWNGTFTVTQNGNYDVYINATDYAGNTRVAGLTTIEGDVTNPIITINSPVSNALFSSTPPNFNVTISDSNLNETWYTIDNGATNITFIGSTGTIDSTEWNQEGNGPVTIRFYASDTAGNVNWQEVTVRKDIILPYITITNPSPDGAQIGGSVISIIGDAFGTGSNIASIYINNSKWGISKQPQTDPSGSISGSFIFNNNSFIAPGFYWVAINITDQAGNVNVSYRYFEVVDYDIFPPILIITSITPNPSNGYTEITVTSNEDLISAPLLNITAPNASVYYPLMILINTQTWRANYTVKDTGIYTVQINGTDLDSNVGYESTTFTGDVEAPTITLASILPNPSNGLVTITATNSSNDIDGNGIWATVITPSFQSIFVELNYQGGNTWSGTFTVTESGDYVVNLNATDYANNTGYAGPLGITGDLVPPSISIVNALPNPSNGLVIITATNSSNDINGNGIWATVTTPSSQSIFVELNYQGGNIWNGTFTVVENGLYIININATDIAGNTGYAGPMNIDGDVSSPIIDINSPKQDNIFGTNAPAFNITITEPNLDSTWYTLYNGTSWSNNESFSGLIDTITIPLWNSMPNGVITIKFYANDTFGMIGTSQVNITKDAINPIINITSPIDEQVFSGTVPTFNINVSELHFQSTWYSLFDGITWSNNISFSGSTGTIQQALWTSMPNGNITIRFYADDTAGNIGYKDVIVIKESPPPPPNGGDGDIETDSISSVIFIGTMITISAVFILLVRRWKISRNKRFMH